MFALILEALFTAQILDSIGWCEDYWMAAPTALESNSGSQGFDLAVSVYTTGQNATSPPTSVDEEKVPAEGTRKYNTLLREGRPDLKHLIRSACDEISNQSIAVICELPPPWDP